MLSEVLDAARILPLVLVAATWVSAAPAPPPSPRFVDVTARTGVDFRHRAARTPEKQLPETMGSGVALLDFDGDGDLDLYFVQGGPASRGAPRAGSENELWRNDGAWRFARVPDAAGAGDDGLGMGACVGDVDADGDPDLVVTNVGSLALYRNGAGRFVRDAASGLASSAWGCSCTFADVDGDRDLDLYVTNYVDWDPVAKNPYCGDARRQQRAYCHPHVFAPQRDALWVNDGRGRFTDGTVAAGLAGAVAYGLGVVATDADLDGDVDFYVANDAMANFLLVNDGKGRFSDRGVLAGVAYDENGVPQSGMGVDAGDVDGDGLPDLFVTNLDVETNTLYASTPRRGSWRVATATAGLADAGPVGFGTEMADFDLDHDLDIHVANGHIIDNIPVFSPGLAHAQPDQLFVNGGGGRFRLAPPDKGGVGGRPLVARGSAAGDLDLDGDLDLVVTTNDGPAVIYENAGAERRPHLALELRGTRSHPDAFNARVEIRRAGAAGPVLAREEVQAGRSYLSQGTKRVHVASPEGGADVTVTWPSGLVETWPLLAPGSWLLVEGASKSVAAPLPKPGAPAR